MRWPGIANPPVGSMSSSIIVGWIEPEAIPIVSYRAIRDGYRSAQSILHAADLIAPPELSVPAECATQPAGNQAQPGAVVVRLDAQDAAGQSTHLCTYTPAHRAMIAATRGEVP